MPSRVCTFGDHQLAELVDVAGLGAHDHVVGAGDVLGEGDALDLGDRAGDLGGLADVGLDQDVGLDDHVRLLAWVGSRCRGSTYRAAAAGSTGRPSRDDRRGRGSGGMGPCPSPLTPPLADVGEFGADRRASRDAVPAGRAGAGRARATTRRCCGSATGTSWSPPTCSSRAGTSAATGPSAADIGHKAAAANLSDINAMGGRAHSLTVGLAAPARPAGAVGAGLRRRHRRGVRAGRAPSVVGGDLTRADAGRDRGHRARARDAGARCSARAPSPATWSRCAGRQGWAAGGLAVLGRGLPLAAGAGRGLPPSRAAVRRRAGRRGGRRHRDDRRLRRAARRRRPRRRRTPGWRSTSHATPSRSPSRCRPSAPRSGADPMQFVLGGGDDHALVATFPAARAARRAGPVIGAVADGRRASPSTARRTTARPAGRTSEHGVGNARRPPDPRGDGGSRERVQAGQRVTLPALRQPVQTLRRLGVPLTVARTRWMLGLKRRLVILRDHGRLLPKPGSWRRCRRRQPP